LKTSDPEFIDLIQKQKLFEEKTVETLSDFLKRVDNRIVKLMIHGLILDSLKHADVLQAISALIKGEVFSDVDKFEVDKGLETHIKNEQIMMDQFNEIISKTKDEKVNTILKQLVKEEERHHKDLKEVFEILKNLGNVSEEDWWNYLNQWANFNF
jgi:rubrerythrin